MCADSVVEPCAERPCHLASCVRPALDARTVRYYRRVGDRGVRQDDEGKGSFRSSEY